MHIHLWHSLKLKGSSEEEGKKRLIPTLHCSNILLFENSLNVHQSSILSSKEDKDIKKQFAQSETKMTRYITRDICNTAGMSIKYKECKNCFK